MPRIRKNKDDAWMPPRVYMGRSAYEFHPINGGNIRLCDKTATQAQVWAAWEALINERPDTTTLAGLVERFLKSADFFGLAVETQKDYHKYSQKILSVFGKMPPDAIRPEHVRRYMDKRGLRSHTQANREKSFMSRVYRWAYERGYVKGNPTKGVRQFKEPGRDRYITHQEYLALYGVTSDVVRVAMELAYLCCARQKDVLNMMKSQFLPEGILIKQSKTAVGQIKAWSPRLREAIKLASTLPLDSGRSTLYVIHQRSGDKYSRHGFNSRWRQAKKAAKKRYPELDFNFTFHDLKAKGISDLKGNIYEKQAISGHKNVEQTARYNRKIPIVPTVDGQ
ncbi:integrase [Edwardsiella ictaluri]|uniref:Site-specific recombinase, phage integrase family, putative n=2 Tax=Edwardsiella ictaluri TaxID=67780 RepID=C5BFY1_EDWI9|nr:tyrosine-type recombinase/integrase [Edwardsiella ictaluri]ACR69408.1 site-specific recombinase, phage integrase family, putative [Edwardsiella ictaluri 93-146]AVZ83572.1 integrase [Edwardsiella ictaluri]EKS7764133.1 tyrosine-type recombinase/integrase [Edwardsiella ictaluri]EKS7770993.1 tyrosine-type recombinase/integrase [Edwardsiella ictaluri]EKS7774084.1 tyrosine-type recombinase/integrase [Edwardsiella ictaluri]